MTNRIPALASILALASIACGDSEAPPLVEVRDSTGIEIVVNYAPASSATWTTAPEPTLDLGGDPDGEIALPAGGRVLADTLLAFYNRGTCEIWLAGLDGTVTNRFGRCGQGPGDLSDFFGLWAWRGDSILVADQIPPRLSVFSLEGDFGRTLRRSPIEGLPLAIPLGLIDGRIVLRNDESPLPTPGLIPLETVLATTNLEGDDVRRLGRYRSRMYEVREFSGTFTGRTLSFSGRTAFAVGASHVYAGLPDRYEIRALTPEGVLDRIVRRAFEPVPVEPRHIEWLMNRALDQATDENQARAIRRSYGALQTAEVMPAFGVPEWPGLPERAGPPMIVDDTDHLWVFEHYEPGEFASRWAIFDPSGQWVANGHLPDGFVPTHIGEDFALGLWEDDLDLTHLQMFEVRRE